MVAPKKLYRVEGQRSGGMSAASAALPWNQLASCADRYALQPTRKKRKGPGCSSLGPLQIDCMNRRMSERMNGSLGFQA